MFRPGIRIAKDTRGAAAIEYGLIAALISIAAITGMSTLGTNLNNSLSKVTVKMK